MTNKKVETEVVDAPEITPSKKVTTSKIVSKKMDCIHELIDRTSIIGTTFETFIVEHKITKKLSKETRKLINKTLKKINETYQALNQEIEDVPCEEE